MSTEISDRLKIPQAGVTSIEAMLERLITTGEVILTGYPGLGGWKCKLEVKRGAITATIESKRDKSIFTSISMCYNEAARVGVLQL